MSCGDGKAKCHLSHSIPLWVQTPLTGSLHGEMTHLCPRDWSELEALCNIQRGNRTSPHWSPNSLFPPTSKNPRVLFPHRQAGVGSNVSDPHLWHREEPKVGPITTFCLDSQRWISTGFIKYVWTTGYLKTLGRVQPAPI